MKEIGSKRGEPFGDDRLAADLLSFSETVSLSRLMNRSLPHCDRHTNLQMVPCWLQRDKAVVPGHVCPVPGCGRYHADGVYLEGKDVEMVLGPKSTELKKAIKKDNPQPPAPTKPLNRQEAARAAILRAIQQKPRN